MSTYWYYRVTKKLNPNDFFIVKGIDRYDALKQAIDELGYSIGYAEDEIEVRDSNKRRD